jgi:hypothetical protein
VLKEVFELYESRIGPLTYRVYTPQFAPLDLVMFEAEFESLADHQETMAQYTALPEHRLLLAKLDELTEAGGICEAWSLVEQKWAHHSRLDPS